jgi:hypothetical protein
VSEGLRFHSEGAAPRRLTAGRRVLSRAGADVQSVTIRRVVCAQVTGNSAVRGIACTVVFDGEVSRIHWGRNANGSAVPRKIRVALALFSIAALLHLACNLLCLLLRHLMRVSVAASSCSSCLRSRHRRIFVDECHSSSPYVPLVADAIYLLQHRGRLAPLAVW